MAKRTVRVQCHGAGEWAALGLPPNTLGVVRYLYSPYTMRIVQVEDIIHLYESVCLGLQRFGEAVRKPTKCETTVTQERTVYENVQVKKKVFYWKRITVKGGKTKRVRKSRYVWVTKQVPRTVSEEVPGPRVPCYGSAEPLPGDYGVHTLSLHVLAHETIHILDFYPGAFVQTQESAESRAECYGMQLLPPVAYAFGADEDDARAMGKYYWENEYPKWQGTPYWTAACQPNSPADLSPNDGFWPRIALPSDAASTKPLGIEPPLVWATSSY